MKSIFKIINTNISGGPTASWGPQGEVGGSVTSLLEIISHYSVFIIIAIV